MIDAKEAHLLTCKAIMRNRLEELDIVEEKIKKAADKEKFTITIDNIYLNDDCVRVLEENGYKIECFKDPYKYFKSYTITW